MEYTRQDYLNILRYMHFEAEPHKSDHDYENLLFELLTETGYYEINKYLPGDPMENIMAKRYLKYDCFKIGLEETVGKELQKYIPAIEKLLFDNRPEFFKRIIEYDNKKTNIFKLPKRPKGFIGRDSDLEKIDTQLDETARINLYGATEIRTRERRAKPLSKRKTKKHTVFGISAIGGQGKTWCAIEYAYRQKKKYQCILWIDMKGEKPDRQLADFVTNKLNISKCNSRYKERYESESNYYWHQIREKVDGNTLVILDDVSEDFNIKYFLPEYCIDDTLHFITTSRNMILSKEENMNLRPLSAQEAGELFIQESKSDLLPLNENVKLLVIKTLGGHALSITIVAKYCQLNNIKRPEQVAEQIQNHLLENVVGDIENEDYQLKTINAALNISFDGLPVKAQLLLMLIGMYPRISIPKKLLDSSLHEVKSTNKDVVSLIKEALSSYKKKEFSLSILLSSHFVQDADENEEKCIQLHEIIYDFISSRWKKHGNNEPLAKDLGDQFIQSSIKHAGNIVDLSNSKKSKITSITTHLKALTGLLLPKVTEEKKTKNFANLLEQCLLFWFKNYRFHQFVYDVGIQDFLLPHLESISHYLKDQRQTNTIQYFIILKLLGHAFYANPEAYGEQSKTCFKQAITIGKALTDRETDRQNLITLQWYEIFLLDHLLNIESKSRTNSKPGEPELTKVQVHKIITNPIANEPYFHNYIELIESFLPSPLKQLNDQFQLKREEYPLLLRAAHYWGHRGNQDSFTLLQQIVLHRITLPQTMELASESKRHYIKAINYRYAALLLFYTDKMKKGELYKKVGTLPYLSKFSTLEPIDNELYIEDFTQYFQGVGDLAHQYRGLNFVIVMQICLKLAELTADFTQKQEIEQLVIELKRTYEAAERLWNYTAYKNKKKDKRSEPPLKYILWMCSSEVILHLINTFTNECRLQSLDEELAPMVKAKVDKTIKEFNIDYSFVEKEQLRQVELIWNYLKILQNTPS